MKVGDRIVIPGVRAPAGRGAKPPAAVAQQQSLRPRRRSPPPSAPTHDADRQRGDARGARARAAEDQDRRHRRHADVPLAGARPRHPGFGPKPSGQQNDGINVAVPEGTPIKAAEDGVVAYAGNELKGYGNLVLVRHANGYVTAYAHASELMVKRDDRSSAAR